MKRTVLVLILFSFIAFNVHAQLAVIDVSANAQLSASYIQLIVQAGRELQSLLNEQQMIQNQLQQLANYKNQFGDVNSNLIQINLSINAGIQDSNQAETLLNQMQQTAQGLGTNVNASQETQQLGQNTMQIIQNSLNTVQKQRSNYQTEQASLSTLMNKNNSAVGETQALQTIGQLEGQMIQEQQETRELLNELITEMAALVNQRNQEQQDEANAANQLYQPIPAGTSSFNFPQDWSTNSTN